MNSNQDYLNEHRKSNGKNTRYNFNNFSNDVFYIPTDTSQNYPNRRRQTTASYRKNKLDKEFTGFPSVYTSGTPHNTANLYLNKKNFSFKKKPSSKANNYYDKEKLYQNMVKLQSSLNMMNLKYHKQKMENDKQAKEIKKQNQFLNLINSQNMRNMDLIESYYFKNENNESKQDKNDDLIRNLMRDNASSLDLNFIKLDDKKFNLKSINNSNKNFTEKSLRRLYEDLYQECKSREKLLISMEKDKEKYTRENGILKVANETLISNLKCHMKQLEKENEQKDNQIKELKKNLKCSRYTELLKENEILNQEMEKLKNKLKNALILINDYKKQEEEIKKLYEVIKKKDFKIKALELELSTLANNSDETTKKLQDEITAKDKLLKQQERDFKKSEFIKFSQTYNDKDRYGATDNIDKNKTQKKEIDRKKIYKKYPELYLFYLEMKHRDINSSKDFSNEILKKIKDTKNIKDAKIEYVNLLWNYFNINDEDKLAKEIIVNLANKEFINHRTIFEIKKSQINILDILYNKKTEFKSNEEIKNYIDDNNLEELIKRTFMETDINKLGYINYDDMVNVINEINLVDFIEEILLLTKSEIFNRFDYYNLLSLFNTNNETEKRREENNVNDINNKESIKENEKESTEKKEGSDENTKKKEDENQNNEQINNEENNEKSDNKILEDKLKIIVDKIKKEGGHPVKYFSQLKEKLEINGEEYEVINITKLKEFLNTKEIDLNDEEIKLLKEEFGIKKEESNEENNDDFINNENFEKKLLNIIQNDSDNDDDNYMENIPKMDFADEIKN